MDRFNDEVQSVEIRAAILDACEALTQTCGILGSYVELNASYFEDMLGLVPGKSLQNSPLLSGYITMYITQW